MNNTHFIEKLKRALPKLQLHSDVPWSDISTLGIGSNVTLLAEPSDDLELIELMKYCDENSVPVRTIGGGSNIVGCDTPFEGLIIRLIHNCFSRIVYGRHQHITAGAGIKLSEFLRELAGKGLGGAAALAPIPGTLGGALRMNAGARGVEIKDFVTEICGLKRDGTPWTASVDELNWSYRNVDIPDDIIITGAICEFRRINSEKEFKLINNEFNWRNKHFPPGRSTGCVFRNPASDISAGKLIDDSGCKGITCGGALVSDKHANYLLNSDNATEKEYAELIIAVKKKVIETKGIKLIPELHFIDQVTAERVNNTPEIPDVIVLKGGNSNERNVSIMSGDAVEKALKIAGYNVKGITITELHEVDKILKELKSDDYSSKSPNQRPEQRDGLLSISKSTNIIFPVLHGGYGEDGKLQKLLEEAQLPFVGCDSVSCDLAMNKEKSKKIMKEQGLSTPDYAIIANPSSSVLRPSSVANSSSVLRPSSVADSSSVVRPSSVADSSSSTAETTEKATNVPSFPSNLSLPVIVKPPEEGSTVGISLVRNEQEWATALENAFKYSSKALVEEFIEGKEITVGIFGDKVLPVIEIQFPGILFDYDAKYEHRLGETLYLCPPETINIEIQKKAQEAALKFAEAINVCDLARVDLMVDSENKIYILEANSMPGFTSSSLLPKAAAQAGISFPELCGTLVQFAYKRSAV